MCYQNGKINYLSKIKKLNLKKLRYMKIQEIHKYMQKKIEKKYAGP